MQVEWSDHPRDLVTRFSALLSSHSLLDITLAAEGRFIKAHKVILAASSKYFEVKQNITFLILHPRSFNPRHDMPVLCERK